MSTGIYHWNPACSMCAERPHISIQPQRYHMRQAVCANEEAVAVVPIRNQWLYMSIEDAKRLRDDLQQALEEVT